MINRIARNTVFVSLLFSCFAMSSFAQDAHTDDCDEQCQALRDSQDPTAAVNGVFFSNTIGFGPTSDETSYDFQIQPIMTAAQEDWGDVILRGVIPILGVPLPNITSGSTDTDFGLSDTVVQAFYVPSRQDGPLTFAFGPQASLATHTDDTFQAAGWGGGVAVAGFGFAGPLSYGGLFNHLWGEDDFSTSTLQPIVFYNLNSPGIGDWFFGYSNSVTYDWSADNSDDAWTVPVGLEVGKTFVLPQQQHAITVRAGVYSLLEAPQGSNDWEFTFDLNILN